jgi:hypothetical protein
MSVPDPSEIWGRDMTRATFRRFVEADAREARTLQNLKLCEQLKKEAKATKTNRIETHPSQDNTFELSAMDEFRVMRAFPTLLKIISKQGVKNQTVDTGRFSRQLRTSRKNMSAATNGGNVNNTLKSPLLSMQSMGTTTSSRVALRMNDLVKIRNQRTYIRGDVELMGTRVGKVTLESTTGIDIGCSWRLVAAKGKTAKATQNNFFERVSTGNHIKYGMEFRIVLDYMSNSIENERDGGGVKDQNQDQDQDNKDNVTYILCSSMVENKDPSLFHTNQRYETTLCVMEASNPKARGKASLWCFEGGAKGKPVLSSRQIRLRSMNCSDREGLLRGEGSKVKVRIRMDSDNVLVPTPQDASYNWFVELVPNEHPSGSNQEEESEDERFRKQQTLTIQSNILSTSASASASATNTNTNTNTNNNTNTANTTTTTTTTTTAVRPIVTPSPRSRASPRSMRMSAAKSVHTKDRTDSDFIEERPAFSPCSPTRARDALSRSGMTISVGVPYTALKDQQKRDAREQKKGRLAGHFSAAGKVGHRYVDRSGQFLHSPDARCVRMEQSFLKERAEKGLQLLREKHANNRKHWKQKQQQKEMQGQRSDR